MSRRDYRVLCGHCLIQMRLNSSRVPICELFGNWMYSNIVCYRARVRLASILLVSDNINFSFLWNCNSTFESFSLGHFLVKIWTNILKWNVETEQKLYSNPENYWMRSEVRTSSSSSGPGSNALHSRSGLYVEKKWSCEHADAVHCTENDYFRAVNCTICNGYWTAGNWSQWSAKLSKILIELVLQSFCWKVALSANELRFECIYCLSRRKHHDGCLLSVNTTPRSVQLAALKPYRNIRHNRC